MFPHPRALITSGVIIGPVRLVTQVLGTFHFIFITLATDKVDGRSLDIVEVKRY